MALTFAELKVETAKLYNELTPSEWESKILFRGIAVKFDSQLEALKQLYIGKIDRIRQRLRGNWSVTITPSVGNVLKTTEQMADELFGQIQRLLAKEARLLDKFAAVCKEIELREKKLVSRTPHGTTYYIDYDNGSDSNDGLSTTNAWKTLTKYTTTTVRTPGDIAYLRANIVWDQGTEAIDVTFDEDGTIDNYIKIIGCDSVVNDPWSDSSDVLPIIDFQDAAYQVAFDSDDYWWLERVHFKQSNDAAGCVFSNYCVSIYLKSCTVSDGTGASAYGVMTICSTLVLDSCSFYDNYSLSVYAIGGQLHVLSSIFNGGSDVSTDVGINSAGGTIFIEDSSFGATTTHDAVDVYTQNGGITYSRNCAWAGLVAAGSGGVHYSEDDNATFENQLTSMGPGVEVRSTSVVHTGGADSSALMAPNVNCGSNNPLRLGHPLKGFAQLWLAAGSYTATVYARVGDAWDTPLTAAQAYMVTSELDNAGNATRVKRQSTQQIANDGSWTAFTTSISPAREGFVYFWFFVAEYEDETELVYVDIKPIIS